MEIRLGTLSGRLGNAFLRRHGLTSDLTPYIQSVNSIPFSIRLDAAASGGQIFYNANLKPDGTFEVGVPPGTYDLNLLVLGPGFRLKEKIPVENGIVIQEKRRQIVNLP
jgi:hypothetical protein